MAWSAECRVQSEFFFVFFFFESLVLVESKERKPLYPGPGPGPVQVPGLGVSARLHHLARQTTIQNNVVGHIIGQGRVKNSNPNSHEV
jgi:hypothetical protein